MTTSAANQRLRAARIVGLVLEQRKTLDQVMHVGNYDAFETELAFGVLRHYFTLEALVDERLQRPLNDRDQDLLHLMLVGTYQLVFTRVPAYAAINETVAAASRVGKRWAKGLLNGVLRNIAREAVGATQGEDPSAAARRNHPNWLRERLDAQYVNSDEIMCANQTRAPLCIRVNQLQISPDAYRAKLSDSGLRFSEGAAATALQLAESITLDKPVPGKSLPGWAEGEVAIQDGGAQIAAPLLGQAQPHRLLDACTAPGGKLAHYLERFPGTDAVALDSSMARLEDTALLLQRLGHRVPLVTTDTTSLDWWDDRPFQRILLDAPCSGTGTIRRHPDIRLLRQVEDLANYQQLQRRLLNKVWRVLEPGGRVLYCTCSVLDEENDEVIEWFLSHNADVRVLPIQLPTGLVRRQGWQLLPTDLKTDGFYYALLEKRIS